MTPIHILICLLLAIFATSRQEIWIRYEALRQESEVFEKYYHRMKQGYFVDLGGYNPIYQSNTVKLSNWNGIIVQANQRRSQIIRDFQPHITSLNFAVSNVSGEMATFYEADFDEASSLSQQAITNIGNMGYKQQKVMVINMADLCHKYYKAKPNLLNIDVEGIGEIVLKANDWTNDKCVPDIIYAEDANPNIRAGLVNLQQVVLSHNYTKMDRVVSSTLFIHNSKLQFYKKEAQANAQYINNKVLYQWADLASSISNLLGKRFDKVYDTKTNPAYPFFRQPNIIDVVEINKYSNFISTVGPNRPIIIMEYDQKISTISISTNKFNIQSVKIDNRFNFKKITADYEGQKQLIIYVFDHQKYDQFEVKLLEAKQNKPCPVVIPKTNPSTNPSQDYSTSPIINQRLSSSDFSTHKEQSQPVKDNFKQILILGLSLIIVLMIVLLWRIQKKLSLKKRENIQITVPQSQVKQITNNQL